MKRSFIAPGVLLLLAAVLLILRPFPARADAPGAAVFKAKCAACHAADGSGSTPVGKNMKLRDLGSPDVQKLSDADLTKIIADGKGKMPGYAGKISADDIKALVANIRGLKK